MKKSYKYASLLFLAFFCLSSTVRTQERESKPDGSGECNVVYVLGIENKATLDVDENITLLQVTEKVDGKLPDFKVKFVTIYRLVSETDRKAMKFKLKDLRMKKVEGPVLQPCDIVDIEKRKRKYRTEIPDWLEIL
jgi:hypothetical protein